MDLRNQTHNDIKPQNFLVKFKNGRNDITQIEIVLTDFGMAESDSKGGTPIFASPECYEKKNKSSDIFSFGRVILFLLLSKTQFLKWLFVPLKSPTRLNDLRISTISYFNQHLYLVSKMISLSNRISLKQARTLFNQQRQMSKIKLSHALVTSVENIIKEDMSDDFESYISELSDFRLENSLKIRIHSLFSKMTFAHLSQATAESQRYYHHSQNTFNQIQNSLMTKEIHDQGM